MSVEDDKEETERCLSEMDSRMSSRISISNTVEPSYENSNVAIFEVTESIFIPFPVPRAEEHIFDGLLWFCTGGLGLAEAAAIRTL